MKMWNMILAEFSTNQIEHVCPLEKQRFLVQSNQFKEFIKRSLVDDGFDQKTFQALPISIIPLRKLCVADKSQLLLWLENFNCSVSCLKVVFQVYSIWVPLRNFLKRSRAYLVRIQGTESVATINWSFLPRKARRCPLQGFILETSPRPARINLISFLGGPKPCRDTPHSPHAPSLRK